MTEYNCHNHEPRVLDGRRLDTLEVQDGWTDDGRRRMRAHTTEWLPIECGYTESGDDERCAGCNWIQEGADR